MLFENKLRKMINEAVNEAILNEKSLNRSIHFMKLYDIACLSAFRGQFKNATACTLDDRPEELKQADLKNNITDPQKKTVYNYTKAENIRRNRNLKASLLKYGYGVTRIAGNYIENYNTPSSMEVGEESFFIVNLNDDPSFFEKIFELSEYYNQDCFLYKPKDSEEGFNVGTNFTEWPGYGVQEPAGKFHAKVDNEFLSRIGNSSFAFIPDGAEIKPQRSNTFSDRKRTRIEQRKNDVIETYETFSRNERQVITNIHFNNLRHINEMKS